MIGFLRSTTSLGWTARQMSDIARAAGLEVYGFDVAKAFAAEHLLASTERVSVPPASVVEGEATLLICVNPDQFAYAAAFLPAGHFRKKICDWLVCMGARTDSGLNG